MGIFEHKETKEIVTVVKIDSFDGRFKYYDRWDY